jgi:hypothetical protein
MISTADSRAANGTAHALATFSRGQDTPGSVFELQLSGDFNVREVRNRGRSDGFLLISLGTTGCAGQTNQAPDRATTP